MRLKKSIRFIIIAFIVISLCIPAAGGAAAVTPGTPSISSVKAESATSVSVSWKAVKGAESYDIYRTTATGGNYIKLASTQKTNYVDKTAYPNITYRYSLKAVSGSSTGKYAGAKTVTTPYKSYKDTDKAVFTNSFLESWVRKKLNKNSNQTITIKDLDRFTKIGFAAGTEISDFDYNYSSGAGGVQNGSDNSTKRGFDFYDLKDFAQFRKLEILYILGQQVTDISPLANLKSLKNLNLTSNHVYDINVLRNVQGLETLILESNPVEDLNVIPFLTSLWALNINNTPVASIKPLETSNIGNLTMKGVNVTDLSPVSKMKLDSLDISGNEYPDYSFLKNNKTITSLIVSDLTDDKAKVLSGTKLEWLFLISMTDGSLTNVQVPSLKSVIIYHSSFSNLDFIKNCTNLQEFEASNAALEDISGLSRMAKLSRIALTQTNTLDVSVLKSLSKLKDVTLPANAKGSYDKYKNTVSWKPEFAEGSYNGSLYKYARFPVSKNPMPKPSAITTAAARYVDIGKAGTYNKSIITDGLLNKATTLPDASNQKLPYWKGTYIDCYKFSVNNQFDPGIMSETVFQFLSENGLNYLRIPYSFSYLHDPDNTNHINLSELERLDEIISWGIKHNVHVQIAMTGLPGKWNVSSDEEGVNSTGGVNYINSGSEQKLLERYWSMLAGRYAQIPNKYLSFDLYAEPNIWFSDASVEIVRKLAGSIWTAEGDKPEAERRILVIEYGMRDNDERSEELAKIGCAFSAGFLAPHRFAVGRELTGFYEDYPYLSSTDTWPYFFQHSIGSGEDKAVTITSEEALPAGTEIRVYLHKDNNGPLSFALQADGEIISEQSNVAVYEKAKDNYYTVTLTKAAKSIKFINRMNNGDDINIYQITVHIPGRETVHLVPSSFANLPTDYSNLVLTISKDLSISSNIKISSDWYYNTQISPYVEFAKAHNIGYIVHESGGGYAGDDIYKDYMEMQLNAFEKHQVAWTAECINSFFLYPQRTVIMKEYKNTGWYYDTELTEIIRKFTD
jgi:hypothetical protein